MELSSSANEGVQLAGDSTHMSDASFPHLVTRVCEGILDKNAIDIALDDDTFSAVDKAVLKQAYAGLATLVLEAAKHDAGESNLSTILEDCKFGADRAAAFTKIFLERKPFIQILLGGVNSSLPHIVDVDWRLDYYIKNNHLDKINEPVYLVCLKTEKMTSKGTQDIQFMCTMEQLQDLVGKLKDATKSLEKFSQL